MLNTYTYVVAGFAFQVCLPHTWDVASLLPSFRPFRHTGGQPADVLFSLIVAEGSFHEGEGISVLLDETCTELGRMFLWREARSYRIDLRTTLDQTIHSVRIDQSFSSATASLTPEDPQCGGALTAMLQALFSQAVLSRQGVLVHAACVARKGKAYLFMGKSGTGKSTHAGLWLKSLAESDLLNDDNPVLRIVPDGTPMAYGTPWSGKTPCYKNQGYPVGGIARIRQASENRFIPQRDIDAFVTVLPGCAVFPQAPGLHDKLCDTLIPLTASVRIGIMECRPNKNAARVCAKALGATKTLKSD